MTDALANDVAKEVSLDLPDEDSATDTQPEDAATDSVSEDAQTEDVATDVQSEDTTTDSQSQDAATDVQSEDTAVTDTQPKDTAVTDTQPKDTAVTDTQPKDTAVTDTQPKDTSVNTKPQNTNQNTVNTCCQENSGAGCNTPVCESAVCFKDPYCCEALWDNFCATCAKGGKTATAGDCKDIKSSCNCSEEKPDPPPKAPSHFELAKHWAPVWYHDTDDTKYSADYITAYDFDGDTISNNNWENLDKADANLKATIYFWVIESKTHWFIGYADFHPRDWTEICNTFLPFQEPCHENDMEGALVMVRKSATQTHGTFELLYTEAHNTLHIFTNNPLITEESTANLESTPVTFENGSHPELYVESKGHGVCALYYNGNKHCKHPIESKPPKFPGGDGIVYRYKGFGEKPESGNDPDVGYSLISFENTLWKRRFDICDDKCTFDQTMTYDGVKLGKAFNGDTWGKDKA
ncbi:MAG TPA: hypothetical protein EYN66_24815, partial [Myxococcales bacterium]|nr:hypothetical protein [Myxococcales bacterium]